MDDASTVDWMTKAITKATRSARFSAGGTLPKIDPRLEVDGLGPVKLPLTPKVAKQLIAHCRVAPYGKGTKTLVNTKVRNTFELDPKRFHMADEWDAAIDQATRQVAGQLGLPAEQLEAKLYKLLVYERGGFFLSHRDSEKLNRMVASMIVVLPTAFEGGTLVVCHGAAKHTFEFEDAARGGSPRYVAFYADCNHEVQRVTAGRRLALAYNLVLRGGRRKPPAAALPDAPADPLVASVRSWIAMQPAEPLVFALEHHYTQRGLSLDLLKGADRQIAELVVAAADKTDGCVHLAQVTRHLLQFADDGSYDWGYSRRRRTRSRALELGEVYEDDVSGTKWTDASGKKQPIGEIAFDSSAIVASVPIDDWKPTSEEYEGYTGNAGNTLDRWYHRSAIVLWQREHHFDILARSGRQPSINLFGSMVSRLAKTPKKRLEQARDDCVRFARAIIVNWPVRTARRGLIAPQDERLLGSFAKQLLELSDRETIDLFLSKLPGHDDVLRLDFFVRAACREFGWGTFTAALKQFLAPPVTPDTNPPRQRGMQRTSSLALRARLQLHRTSGHQEVAFRDVQWLSAICCNKSQDPDKAAVAPQLCTLAVERFCQPRPPQSHTYGYSYRREPAQSVKSLPLLLKALVAINADELLARVIDFVRCFPEEFSLDDAQVPCLRSLIPWAHKRSGSDHPQLARWLTAVRRELQSATAAPPSPPTDWARPAEVSCDCRFCTRLNAFLSDPTAETTRIPAREDMRRHLTGMIGRHQCDVQYTLERKGSPYSLVLTKNTGSFDRAVKRFQADQTLLECLPS